MKKFTLIYLLAMAMSIGNLQAQSISKNVDIKWGKLHKEKKGVSVKDIIGYDDEHIYLIKTKSTGFRGSKQIVYLQKVSHDMIKRKSAELSFDKNGKKREFEFMMQSKDKFFAFSSFKNQKLKKNILFVQSINTSSLSLNDDLKVVAEIDYSDNSRYNAGSFDYAKSIDESKILLYYNLPYDKNENEKFGFHAFDADFNELWEQQIELPYEEDLFEIMDYEIDNAGNAHLLGKLYKEKRKTKRKGRPNFKYQLLSYSNGGEKVKNFPIQIEGKYLTDMQIEINNKLDIICGGFYSSEGTNSIEGSYFIRIDGKSREITSQSSKKFDVDFITQNMTDFKEKRTLKKAEKGKEIELDNYDLDEIILRKDGGAILIGEQYSVKVVTHTMSNGSGGMTSNTTTIFNYNDIIVVNVRPDGEIEWAEKIAKRQVTKNDGGFFSSYISAIDENELVFIFNDDPENVTYDGKGRVKTFNGSKRSGTTMVTLDQSGKQSREVLFLNKEVMVNPRPKVSEQISKSEIIIFGQWRKKQRFAKLRFK